MHVAGSGTLKLPPMKSAPLDNSNDYCTLCGDGSQVLHLCDGKECNCVFLKLQMPVSFFFTYHTCVLSIILTYHVSYFARMIHSRMILDIPTHLGWPALASYGLAACAFVSHLLGYLQILAFQLQEPPSGHQRPHQVAVPEMRNRPDLHGDGKLNWPIWSRDFATAKIEKSIKALTSSCCFTCSVTVLKLKLTNLQL